MRIDRARPADLSAAEALLAACGLPQDGVADALAIGVVARDDGAVVGVAAVERYGASGLLRSVAVDAAHRGTGLGRALVAAAEALARDNDIRDLYLLTETATKWFPQLGYATVPREEAASAVGASVEFTTACDVTAVAMRKTLT